jgi:hypothetical protein
MTTAGGTVAGSLSTTRNSWLKAWVTSSVATAASSCPRRWRARMAPTRAAAKKSAKSQDALPSLAIWSCGRPGAATAAPNCASC